MLFLYAQECRDTFLQLNYFCRAKLDKKYITLYNILIHVSNESERTARERTKKSYWICQRLCQYSPTKPLQNQQTFTCSGLVASSLLRLMIFHLQIELTALSPPLSLRWLKPCVLQCHEPRCYFFEWSLECVRLVASLKQKVLGSNNFFSKEYRYIISNIDQPSSISPSYLIS